MSFSDFFAESYKNEVMDRSMPLKAYRIVYRSRKVNANDQKSILALVDLMIWKKNWWYAGYPNAYAQ